MTNKILKVSVVLIITFSITVLIIRTFFSSIGSPSYKIFRAETDGYYFHRLLGVVPKNYQDRYIETIIDSNDNYELLNLIDQKGATHPNFILLKKNKNEIKFLKAYPVCLVGVSDETVKAAGWEKHVSLLINLEVFNDYIQLKHLTSKNEIIDKYCYFLSYPTEKNFCKILLDSADLNQLLNEHALINKEYIVNSGYKLIEPQSIDFSHANEAVVYCWIYNKGVVKFIFNFNKSALESVGSEIIGFLGNEAPSI
jgi:hypothetical protein